MRVATIIFACILLSNCKNNLATSSLAEDSFVYQPIYESASDEEINTYLAGQEAEELRSLYQGSGKEIPAYLQQGNTAQFRERV